jgi:hypothetical protein
MRRGYKQSRDEILLARLHAGAALAAALLRPIARERHALDVSRVRHRHHHIITLDQILIIDLAFLVDNDGAARRGELRLHRLQLVLDDALDARTRA